ncbi:hypothetical protein A2230_02840 [candidate division WOR-1 bacterium RIFOXYA2_FULL_36_21]|uniref:Peptidase S74 domain-containing protein n=1 Tax=candidate division WOR-1 bacterium RIFOXYB2_FULL_36_35 TaxID=1802578 RepID=A0A1F4S6I0_UNCSA|nr:MAG: hypothetical protein A2230_02840 [candidate division WOR-1 bacterium RIFOXYA2_FULL_36_21]OGC16045.1 MAG: hypothetical protein A2290_00170 [candidate division WOR-1 bacterium RIFOXYB2_FULL_36_35]OGC19879.1 MAG: hypothetical protein A2282_01680 [candidate division WOR-1 bacterium RIFOXYA12_FULL_36_13]
MKKSFIYLLLGTFLLFFIYLNFATAENVDVILDNNDAASSFQIKNLDKTTVASIDATGNITATGTVDAQKGVKYPDGNIQTEAYLGSNNLPNNSGWIKGGGRVTLEAIEDYVGIGTDNPLTHLDVVGSTRITLTPYHNKNVFSIEKIDTQDKRSSVLKFDSSIEDLLIDKDGVLGSVGIGLASPSSKLTVNGTIETVGIGGIKFPDESIQTTASGWTKKENTLILTTSTDKVGIGTTNPTAKLSVKTTLSEGGAAIFGAEDNIASGDYAVAIGKGTQARGNASLALGINTKALADYTIASGGNTVADGLYSFAHGYYTSATKQGSLAFGQFTSADATNAMVLGGGISATQRLLNNQPDSLMIGFFSNIPTFFVGSSEGKGTTGNVGVGTTETAYKLNVAGTVDAQGGVKFPDGNIQTIAYQGGSATVGGGWVAANSVVHLEYATNRVAIGSNAIESESKLAVDGIIETTGGIKFLDESIQTIAATPLPTGSTNNTLRHNETDWISNSFLSNNGTFVGIGSPTPAQKQNYALAVAGTIEAQKGIEFPDKKIQSRAYLGESDSGWIKGNNNVTTESSTAKVGIGDTRNRTMPAKLNVFSDTGNGGAAVIGNYLNTTEGDYSIAIGDQTKAKGKGSFSAGGFTQAKADYSTALGHYTTAGGYYSTAMGWLTSAEGIASTAMGFQSKTTNDNATAIGYRAKALGFCATAIGREITAEGVASVSIGDFSTAANQAFTFGAYLKADGFHAMTLGSGISTSSWLKNSTPNSLMIGFNSNIPTLFVGPSSGVDTTGNVGIGTTDATSKLTVAGIIEIKAINGGIKFPDETIQYTAAGTGNGTVTSVNSGTALAGGPITNTGTLNVKYDNSTISIESQGSLEVKDGGISTVKLADNSVTTDKILNGTIKKEKVALGEFVKKIQAGKNILIFGDELDGTGVVIITAEAPSTGWIKSTGQVALETTGDKVGIGTDAPQAKLSVVTQSGGAATFGKNNEALGDSSVAIGLYSSTTTIAQHSLAVGNYAKANGNNSVVIGDNLQNDADNSLAVGGNFTLPLDKDYSLGIGLGNLDILLNPVGDSFLNVETGNVGIGTDAPTAKLSVVTQSGGAATFGKENTASGNFSVAIGTGSSATNTAAVAIGNNSTASGQFSLALGSNTEAGGNSSIAVGESAKTTSEGTSGHRGSNCMALGGSFSNSVDYSLGIGFSDLNILLNPAGDSYIVPNPDSLISGNGYFGIGTKTPTSKLTVAGTIEITDIGGLKFANGIQTEAYLGQNTGWEKTGGNVNLKTTTDKVGIGTTSPKAKLHIYNGTLLAEGTEDEGFDFINLTSDRAFFWLPSKAALRAGTSTDGSWEKSEIKDYSVAIGNNPIVSGISAFALGESAVAGNDYAVAIGKSAQALGVESIAIGSGAIANASTALGGSVGSISIGYDSQALGIHSIAMGKDTQSTGSYSTAIGYGAKATEDGATSIGQGSIAKGMNSIAIGTSVTASNESANATAIAIGRQVQATKNNAVVIGVGKGAGNFLVNNTENSLMIGFDGTTPILFASGNADVGQVGIGTATPQAEAKLQVNGAVLFEGNTGNTPSSGAGTKLMWIPSKSAFRAGYGGTAWDAVNIGNYSAAMGYNSQAKGQYSFAAGKSTTANGDSSVALGESASANGKNSITLGGKITNDIPNSLMVGFGDTGTTVKPILFVSGEAIKGSVGIGTTESSYKLTVSGTIDSQGGIRYPDGGIQTVAYDPLSLRDNIWSRASTTVYLPSTSDNVSIGTNTSTAKLTVVMPNGGGAATFGTNTNEATGDYSVAIGSAAKAQATCSLVVGETISANTNAINSLTVGKNITNNTPNSIAVGKVLDSSKTPQILLNGYGDSYINKGLLIGSANTDILGERQLYVNGQAFIENLSLDLSTPAGTGTQLIITNDGAILKGNSSSRRYKTDIKDLDENYYKILEAKPKKFKYKDSGTKSIGYIAEDFDDLGLKNLVAYDKENRPDAISYDKISIYLIEIIKDQQTEIKQLKDRLDAIENK